MTLAAYPSQVAQRIFDIIQGKKVTLLGAAGSLYYGDQNKLPTTPTVCVEAGTTDRDLKAAQFMVLNTHECYILVYHSKVQPIETNKKESEVIAEGIAKELDGNPTLIGPANEPGIVTNGFCSRIDPGYAVKDGTLYKAVRIQWNGTTKTRLGA